MKNRMLGQQNKIRNKKMNSTKREYQLTSFSGEESFKGREKRRKCERKRKIKEIIKRRKCMKLKKIKDKRT
jgi:hypothetical protein